jgi:cyclopropane fatty-acyl-phospholipid synthase-like methyltransferase
MPSSYTEGKQTISKWLQAINPKTALDIGPGSGNYERLIKGTYGSLVNGTHFAKDVSDIENNTFIDYSQAKDCEVTGIEAYYPYVAQYGLEQRYKQVIIADVRYLNWDKISLVHGSLTFDVAIAGDILEHLTEEEAKEVFDNLRKVSKNVIISLPIIHFEQGAFGGNPFEIHKEEDWTHDRIFKVFGFPKEFYKGEYIGVYLY